jgi:hypothetical protein
MQPFGGREERDNRDKVVACTDKYIEIDLIDLVTGLSNNSVDEMSTNKATSFPLG